MKFAIALSFAGEDRVYVDQVANLLREAGISVFYDLFEEASLWGKNLYDYLSEVYSQKAGYTIMFISEHYAHKLWTNHERQAMQARAFQENKEYILPARFDDTPIPGVLPTVGYISLGKHTPESFVAIIQKKLVNSGRTIPSESVRRAFFATEPIPRVDPTVSKVSISSTSGEKIPNAKVVALAENGTTKEAVTDENGIALLTISTRRQYRLLIAHEDFPGAVIESWDPEDDLCIVLLNTENRGSVVCHRKGYIPGLEGRLNPIRDAQDRTYLYADNIAIDGGKTQPAAFQINSPIELEDSNGVVMKVRVLEIRGHTSLLEYVRPRYESTPPATKSRRVIRFLEELESDEDRLIDTIASRVLMVEEADGSITPFLSIDIYETWTLGLEKKQLHLGATPVDELERLQELGLVERGDFQFQFSVEGFLEPSKIHLSGSSAKRVFTEGCTLVPAYLQPNFVRTEGPAVTRGGVPRINSWIKSVTFDGWKISQLGRDVLALRKNPIDRAHFEQVKEIVLRSGLQTA